MHGVMMLHCFMFPSTAAGELELKKLDFGLFPYMKHLPEMSTPVLPCGRECYM